VSLSEIDRRSVREEVTARLSQFESNGKLLKFGRDVDWQRASVETI
jgi:hypothetical protein